MLDLREGYNKRYEKKNAFGYSKLLYLPEIRSLISMAQLKPGSTILDVGCGQGFFSNLFHKCNMKVCGIDISETGIRDAQIDYGALGIKFQLGDVLSTPFSAQFDCVFLRSCSLYNTTDFPTRSDITSMLLRHVKQGGYFIFVYNTKFNYSKNNDSWCYHSLYDMIKHFAPYADPKIYFINRIDTLLLGKLAYNIFLTHLNILLSKCTGLGGDLICILRNGSVHDQ